MKTELKTLLSVSLLLTALLSGCGAGDSGNDVIIQQGDGNSAALGTIIDANVNVTLLDGTLLATGSTGTLLESDLLDYNVTAKVLRPFAQRNAGKITLDYNRSVAVSDTDIVLITVKNGTDIDANDNGIIGDDANITMSGEFYAYADYASLKNNFVSANLFTSIAAKQIMDGGLITNTQVKTALTLSAQNIFGEGDYKTLFLFNPAKFDSNGLIEALKDNKEARNTYAKLLSSVYLQGVRENDQAKINADIDNDGVADILYTIFEGDADSDLIPDAIEQHLGKNPLNADEDNNGKADGLEGDPLLEKQWHLRSYGQTLADGLSEEQPYGHTVKGNDYGTMDLPYTQLGYNNGNPIIIQINDIGVEINHPDFIGQLDLSRSIDFDPNTVDPNDPTPDFAVDLSDKEWAKTVTHGTACAGIVGAKTFNNEGVRGIAPFVKIAATNYLLFQTSSNIDKMWYSGSGANEIAVSSNSFGTATSNLFFESIMEKGARDLRDGKGRIYVMAAGNDRQLRNSIGVLMPSSANYSYMANNRFAFTVASLNNDNTYASYSNYGANLLVSGYGGEPDNNFDNPAIATTVMQGFGGTVMPTYEADTSGDYTYGFGGTSAATPAVSAIVGLTLEQCPDLTWRDVKYLVATTAIKVDENNPYWEENAAGHWHSIDYGFGLINAKGLISACTASNYAHLPQEQNSVTTIDNIAQAIPDDETGILNYAVHVDTNIKAEWVGITITTAEAESHSRDLEVSLVSPSGTETLLSKAMGVLEDGLYNSNGVGFRLTSLSFLDEQTQGDWTVKIRDVATGDTHTLQALKLEIYGH